jgi:hypothetical protein
MIKGFSHLKAPRPVLTGAHEMMSFRMMATNLLNKGGLSVFSSCSAHRSTGILPRYPSGGMGQN